MSVVHFSLGNVHEKPVLDGMSVRRITSFLTTRGSEKAPSVLVANRGLAVIGSFVLGVGFLFEDGNDGASPLATMRALVEHDPRNRARIFKYLGGEDLNSHPRQESSRFVIDFGDLTEAEARAWPELFSIVETKVKPARATVQQRDRREEWWRHATRSPVLRAHLAEHQRALAISQVTAHLAFSFIPSDVVISHTTVAVLSNRDSTFAILQSRVHGAWARLHASSMRNDLRYTPTDCFETFPFPAQDPRASSETLEDIGRRLYDFRAKYMVDEEVGLTITYNRLKDPLCTDARVAELRALHEEMDRAVLAAFAQSDPDGRWTEIEVPAYCALDHADKKKLEAFEDAVIDRLFALNARRAEEEKLKGLGEKPAKAKKASGANAKPRKRASAPESQMELPGDGTDRN